MRKRPHKPLTPADQRSPRARVPPGVRVFLNKVGHTEKTAGWAKNLSDGGMFVECTKCKDGLQLDIEVTIQALARLGDTVQKVRLNGWVVHEQDDGIGIQFDELDRDALLTIRTLVDFYLKRHEQ